MQIDGRRLLLYRYIRDSLRGPG